MDLLDSILNGMEKPPSVRKPEIKDKEKREKFEKMQKERQEAERKQKEMLNRFRQELTKRIGAFLNSPSTDEPKSTMFVLKPMNKLYRSIVHEVCEEHSEDLVVHSFGTEELDRHCVIWKKGYEPCDEEIRARKLGTEYKPKTENDDTEETEPATSGRNEAGKDKFWEKYEKIIGENAYGVGSAKIAEPAKQYGCVPIENKKDLRSIEEISNDIRKNKKQKTTEKQEATEQAKDVE